MEQKVPVVEAKAQVKFGFNQITNKTPDIAKWVFRVILYIVALVNIVLDVFPEIPFETKAMLAMYSIKAVALVHMVSKLFGLEVKEPLQTNKTDELREAESNQYMKP